MFQFPGCPSRELWIHSRMTEHYFRRVSPFRHPRIKACLRLPVAFRSLPRLSSASSAMASTPGLQGRGIQHGQLWRGIQHGLQGRGIQHGRQGRGIQHGLQWRGIQHGQLWRGIQHGLQGRGIQHGRQGRGIQHGRQGRGIQHGQLWRGIQHGLQGRGIQHGQLWRGIQHGQLWRGRNIRKALYCYERGQEQQSAWSTGNVDCPCRTRGMGWRGLSDKGYSGV